MQDAGAPPTARRRATAVTLTPVLMLCVTEASWTEAATWRLHAPASLCAYPSLPFPLQILPRVCWLMCDMVVQSSCRRFYSPAPQVLDQLICCCCRSSHSSGHNLFCWRGASPSASELFLCVCARRPPGYSACIGPFCLSCDTIRAQSSLLPSPGLPARFSITYHQTSPSGPGASFLALRASV